MPHLILSFFFLTAKDKGDIESLSHAPSGGPLKKYGKNMNGSQWGKEN